jgi:hypothetical protein
MLLLLDAHGLPLAWSDEFDEIAGSPPEARWWSHEIGSH